MDSLDGFLSQLKVVNRKLEISSLRFLFNVMSNEQTSLDLYAEGVWVLSMDWFEWIMSWYIKRIVFTRTFLTQPRWKDWLPLDCEWQIRFKTRWRTMGQKSWFCITDTQCINWWENFFTLIFLGILNRLVEFLIVGLPYKNRVPEHQVEKTPLEVYFFALSLVFLSTISRCKHRIVRPPSQKNSISMIVWFLGTL